MKAEYVATPGWYWRDCGAEVQAILVIRGPNGWEFYGPGDIQIELASVGEISPAPFHV